jgi:hypothetical protein
LGGKVEAEKTARAKGTEAIPTDGLEGTERHKRGAKRGRRGQNPPQADCWGVAKVSLEHHTAFDTVLHWWGLVRSRELCLGSG